MPDLGIFLIGAGVTLLVAVAMALLVIGAILDGRDEARSRDSVPARRRGSRERTPVSR